MICKKYEEKNLGIIPIKPKIFKDPPYGVLLGSNQYKVFIGNCLQLIKSLNNKASRGIQLIFHRVGRGG